MEGIGRTPFPRERRRHERLELSRALAYQWGMTRGTFRNVDLSLGGIRVQTERPIPVGERLELIVLLEYEAIKPVGKVVWSDPTSNRMYDVAICFESLSHQCLKRLERFLYGTILKEKLARREKALGQSDLEGVEQKSFELGRLRANFLRLLDKSYPGDYQRYARQPRIGENEIRDFLRSKGIDNLDIHYLLKSLRGG